jgi:hypothetical protein
MGRLYYGDSGEGIELPDTLLAHLKVVITTKLRRHESFTLSWRHEACDPQGRSALWLQESIPMRFVFDTEEAEKLSTEVLQQFSRLANSSGGLTIDLADWTGDRTLSGSGPVAVPSAA